MKLTKSKLKQLIKEELENALLAVEAFDVEDPEPRFTAVDPWWLKLTDEFLKNMQNVYRQAPDEGKEYMTKNFEMYAQKWREEQQASEPLHDAGGGQMVPREDLTHYQGQNE